jgi:hypothetical protein
MNVRLWYPHLDVYDTVRRMLALIVAWPERDMTPERLYVSDFYLASPGLLHKTRMDSDTRRDFQALSIMRPEKGFLSYPSPQMLFAKMEPVQKEALRTIVGKGFVAIEPLRQGRIEGGDKLPEIADTVFVTQAERRVVEFLVESFARIGADAPGELRLSTGLRRPGT